MNTQTRGLLEVMWCPTRSGVLASIGKDESVVKIWDVKDNVLLSSSSSASADTASAPNGVNGSVEHLTSAGSVIGTIEGLEASGGVEGDISLNKPFKGAQVSRSGLAMRACGMKVLGIRSLCSDV